MTFGPQPGQLQKVFGPLFRQDRAPMPDQVFGRRAVAFAAFHATDLSTLTTAKGVDLNAAISAVDSSALQWWEILTTDTDFTRLSAVAPVIVPTAAETAGAGGAAVNLWQTLINIYDRAERRALELLP